MAMAKTELTKTMVELDIESVAKFREDRNKPKTLAGVLHAEFAGFRSHAQDITSFVSLLPESCGYASVVGVSIVFKAAERYNMWEQNFVRALKQIKDAIVDEAPAVCPPSFYFALLILADQMELTVFTRVCRGLKAMPTPKAYGRDLMNCLAAMEACCAALKTYGNEREITILQAKFDSISPAINAAPHKNWDAVNGLESEHQHDRRHVPDPPTSIDVDTILNNLKQQVMLIAKDCRAVFIGCR
ncbi:hypothetical protein DL765_004680 [Monosporascus sp. GIB2]|nr:hypothetical protein DL765_004680 [Monosporascus sp. GIB2]